MVLVSGLFGKKQLKETPVPLPPIAPLEAKADITDTWEAVERFPECLLVTDAILSNETKNYMVKEVVFNIESNDQGWCNEDNFEGEYEGSWTWFEVAILRPVEGDAKMSLRDKRNITSEPCIKKHLDEGGIPNELCFFIKPEDGSPFWHLQRNRRGNDQSFLHTVTWNRDGKKSETESLGWDFDAKTGAGSGIEFFSSLQKGDRVAIIARAKQSGSVNYISKATIRINFEGFELANDTPPVGSTPHLANSVQSDKGTQLDVPKPDRDGKLGAPAQGERRVSSSTQQSSSPRVNNADEAPTQLDISSLLEGSKNSQSASTDAGRAQRKGEIPRTPVKGAPTAGTEIVRSVVSFNPSAQPNGGVSDGNTVPPVPPPKTRAKPSRKGSSGSGLWGRLSGGKKSDSNMKAKVEADNSTQATSRGPLDSSQPIVGVNDPEEPSKIHETAASPHPPERERPKSRFGGWGDKLNVKLNRGKTSTTLGNDVDKVEPLSQAEGLDSSPRGSRPF